MALPVTIAADTVAQNSYHGPFKSSGGAFYTILENATPDGNIEAWKATDPTSSFAEQDSGTRPNFVAAALSLNVFQDGDLLHVAAQNSSDDVYYARFNMASDVWDTPDATNEEELVDGAPNGTTDACDIAVLSAAYGTGGTHVKIRVVYQGATDMDMGSNFERVDESNSVDDGATWSAVTQIDNGASAAAIHYIGPRIVLPPSNSDQCHVFMNDATVLAHRAIAGDDTLRTYQKSSSFPVAATDYPLTHGIGFLRSSVSKVRIGFQNLSNSDLTVLEFDAFTDDSDPGPEPESTVHADDVQTDNLSIDACLAVDGSTIRGLYVKATNDDLFEFDDGDSDTYTVQSTAHVTGTVNHISCNVYDRSGAKLAMIYDDAGTVKYDEIDLAVAAAFFPPFRPKQNTLLRM